MRLKWFFIPDRGLDDPTQEPDVFVRDAADVGPHSEARADRPLHALDLWDIGEYSIRKSIGLLKGCAISPVIGRISLLQKSGVCLLDKR